MINKCFDEIFKNLSQLKLAVYAPITYIFPSMLAKYEDMYDTEIEGGKSKFRQVDREKSLQSLMTSNLLKRLESYVHSFRLTLQKLQGKYDGILSIIKDYNDGLITDKSLSSVLANEDIDDDDFCLVLNKYC